jgi:hypothetical protein
MISLLIIGENEFYRRHMYIKHLMASWQTHAAYQPPGCLYLSLDQIIFWEALLNLHLLGPPFSDYSYNFFLLLILVHHLNNWDDRHLLARGNGS